MKIKFLSILLLCASISWAQGLTFNSLVRSSNQQLIEEAVKDGLFLMETSYQLEDSTGQRFGVDDLPYFHKKMYVCFAIEGADVLPKAMFTPWKDDEKVRTYLEAYRPVLYEMNIRTAQDSIFRAWDMTAYKDTVGQWDAFVAARKKDIRGFALDTEAGKKDGWIVLMMLKDNKPTLQCIRKSLQVDSIGEQTVELPNALPATPGGIYVVPVVESVGRVTFRLCGVVLPSDGGNRLIIQLPLVK